MKNILTAMLLVFAFAVAPAQRHPHRAKPSPFQSLKHKKPKKHKKFARPERGERPAFVTPSGKRIGPGMAPHKKRPSRPLPPKPRFLR